ncbi:MAG: lipid-binding SYLF domain-containing protein, partial [Saprospiraceae bacterium]|nr:lipid-binding SYLF domain-containing protein [Saprospiraceae bacterium]
ASNWDPDDSKKVQDAIEAFLEKDPDLERFFQEAYGYAVFPSIGKGAFGIGGATGKGEVFEGTKRIGTARMTQVSIGFQWGGQAYSEIIFFEDAGALRSFKYGDIKFSAQASVVAVDQGASADVAYEEGVAIFTLAKGGLMYEASVGGQKFKYFSD